MYEIIYSPIVQEKLAALKLKLIEMCGENVGIKHFSQAIDGFEVRLTFSNTGIPIKTIYDVGSEFEHYFVIYSHKNYFLYHSRNTEHSQTESLEDEWKVHTTPSSELVVPQLVHMNYE